MPTKNNRRKFLSVGVAAAAAFPAAAAPQSGVNKPVKKVHYQGARKPEKPLFSGIVSYGNLVFIAGIGAHFEGDIKAHTKHVLDQIQQRLESVGSSMDKVLKCNVYLNDLKDYEEMTKYSWAASEPSLLFAPRSPRRVESRETRSWRSR
jgi:2-iminobutanoate/2-iminopropanoate deaminase